ncbi:MAG: hypothetical protein KGH77_04400 [Candidatus Micrarchaeota archaeon]|nr:hypothetical protein [Candidatus Micrarchaeota archaeon]MDE1864635.1 hypothetical protein [Candidatus Micrarchaeota archaeon]
MHYYDTIAFSYFFYNPNEKHRYSPISSSEVIPDISFFSIEEFLHANLNYNASNWENPKTYYQLWEDLENFKSYFDLIEDIQMKEINTVFSRVVSRIINYATEKKLDYNKLYTERKIPEMMDIVHLIVADIAGAHTFITADGKFDFLGGIEDLPLKSVGQIIILDRADFQKEHRVTIHHASS